MNRFMSPESCDVKVLSGSKYVNIWIIIIIKPIRVKRSWSSGRQNRVWLQTDEGMPAGSPPILVREEIAYTKAQLFLGFK